MSRRASSRTVLFATGLLALAASLLPPFETAAGESFTGHMAQHLLMFLAAPLLLVAGDLDGRLRRSLPPATARRVARWERGLSRRPWLLLGAALGVHGLTLAFWHVPAVYDAAVQSGPVHAVEHATLFWGGVAFWWAAAVGARRAEGAAVVAVFVAALQAGSLGALLAFTPRLLYEAYPLAGPWGLTGVEDQALGGIVMWTVGGAVYVAAGAWLFARWLQAEGRRVALLDQVAGPAGERRLV